MLAVATLFPALRANALHDMAGRGGFIAGWHSDIRHRNSVEAERTLAALTEKVDVEIVVLLIAVAVTKLISHRP